ncbi:tumor necrosis factor receptor superfamily member 14-like isoform X2 [Megalobrama amblycephala]|uniref:tumor necrosis factor receptor superfamily member 14-like isoform X2 n=1 Tax=Megalobrama amblycephala TaxID=75352 RepID=UPI0020143952|nr:tumor necrosis factor receptor superfamily member 14-like isoform X2 [Megalobrama amblycephala]
MNMIKLGFILSVASVVTLNFELCFSSCARAEYEVNGECCPMCAPDTSTTCVPCSPSTYTDEPNGLNNCILCSVCDAVQGLTLKRSCIRTANTVCEPLEGFYCIEKNKGSCIFAKEHNKCKPGQYIKQPGTASTDVVCGDCTEGTYSNGSFTTCQPHTKCETEGRREIKPGTMLSDAECGNSSPVGIIVGAIVGVSVLVTAVGISYYFILKQKRQTPETDQNIYPLSVEESEPTSPDSMTHLIYISKSHQSSVQHPHDPT